MWNTLQCSNASYAVLESGSCGGQSNSGLCAGPEEPQIRDTGRHASDRWARLKHNEESPTGFEQEGHPVRAKCTPRSWMPREQTNNQQFISYQRSREPTKLLTIKLQVMCHLSLSFRLCGGDNNTLWQALKLALSISVGGDNDTLWQALKLARKSDESLRICFLKKTCTVKTPTASPTRPKPVRIPRHRFASEFSSKRQPQLQLT